MLGLTIRRHITSDADVRPTLIANQSIAPTIVGRNIRGDSVIGISGGVGKSIFS